jgi:hypothetical protein
METESRRMDRLLRTYFDTNVISYFVRARRKKDYKHKLDTLNTLIEKGVIKPVTSVITEDEGNELKKNDVKNYIKSFEIVQSSIMVYPIILGRDRFGDDYTHGLYDEYFEGEVIPKKFSDRGDALHYVNIIDRENKIELAISGDKELVNKLKTKHKELPTLYFHDKNFSIELMKLVGDE